MRLKVDWKALPSAARTCHREVHGGAFVRQIDELGRVIIPAEVRERLGITDGAWLDVYLDGEEVVRKACRPRCAFCGAMGDPKPLHNLLVCAQCAAVSARLFALLAAGDTDLRVPVGARQPCGTAARMWRAT